MEKRTVQAFQQSIKNPSSNNAYLIVKSIQRRELLMGEDRGWKEGIYINSIKTQTRIQKRYDLYMK